MKRKKEKVILSKYLSYVICKCNVKVRDSECF